MHRPFWKQSRPFQWVSGQRGYAEDMQKVQEVWPTRWFVSQGNRSTSLLNHACTWLFAFFYIWDKLQRVSLLLFKEQVATNSPSVNERILSFIVLVSFS